MYTTQSGQPTAEVTVRKSRLKKYQGNKLYLKNGQEFEIELFNPTTSDILGKISIDGKELSGGGIVIRPGERVFLDRYLDKAQKFKFSTYEVGNSLAVQNAIRDNGKIKVDFYQEYITSPVINWNYNNYNGGNWNTPYYFGSTSNPIVGGTTTTNYCSTNSGNATFTCSTSDGSNLVNCSGNISMDSLNEEVVESNKKETGRIEAGAHSDQELVYVNKNFSYVSFFTAEYQILPESQKTYTSSDIRVYCTKCGKKAKKGENFCSSCGNKL